MKLILAFSIALFAFIMSGLMVTFGITEITNIQFSIWLIPYSLFGWAFFKYKFKNVRSFKWLLLKKYVLVNSFFRKIDTKVAYSEENTITPLQEKAVRLWKLCLKDKETNISCSISNKTRHIEKNNMLITLSPLNQLDYLMCILDTENNKECLYEIRIGAKLSDSVITSFDIENERRMKMGEEERRKSIYKDLDKLLLQEESALKRIN